MLKFCQYSNASYHRLTYIANRIQYDVTCENNAENVQLKYKPYDTFVCKDLWDVVSVFLSLEGTPGYFLVAIQPRQQEISRRRVHKRAGDAAIFDGPNHLTSLYLVSAAETSTWHLQCPFSLYMVYHSTVHRLSSLPRFKINKMRMVKTIGYSSNSILNQTISVQCSASSCRNSNIVNRNFINYTTVWFLKPSYVLYCLALSLSHGRCD